MTKLIIAFRNFANAPKNGSHPTIHSDGEMRFTREESEISNDCIKVTLQLLNPSPPTAPRHFTASNEVSLQSITFIIQLMHSIIQNLEVKIYFV